MIRLDCGKHFGLAAGICRKCAMGHTHSSCLQAGGTPLIALIGQKATPAQQRTFDKIFKRTAKGH